MHAYKSFHIMAIDAGKGRPFLTMTITMGPDVENTCTAQKTFGIEEMGEVRSILSWADHAYLSAGDQLTEDGWTVEHKGACPDAEGFGHVEA